eukprot:scaffold418_cov386-Prasinococcus_capsulatus_cf.AAC.8
MCDEAVTAGRERRTDSRQRQSSVPALTANSAGPDMPVIHVRLLEYLGSRAARHSTEAGLGSLEPKTPCARKGHAPARDRE